MTTHFPRWLLLLVLPAILLSQAAPPKPATDPLDRATPRSAVTAFLQICQHSNYTRAAQYLDLRQLPEYQRTLQGPLLAKQLEAILDSDSKFDVLRISNNPEGDVSDNPNPAMEDVGSVPRAGRSVNLQLERVQLQPTGPLIWLFSAATVAAIPSLRPTDTAAAIEAHLPYFLVSVRFLDTAIWKWLALFFVALAIATVFRLVERMTVLIASRLENRFGMAGRRAWIQPLVQPWLVLLSAMVFVVSEQFIDPSALSRLYIGRAILLAVVWAFAWCLIRIVDLFLSRIDSLLDPRQRVVSHSLIYLGRRGAKVAVVFIGIIIVLDNWGYNMTTMIAGLGVGGIAVALAAQGTIANMFGGVSVIADHPVMVGDFGKFGDVIGTVEDIGLRSTRVRTLNRTVMSIPNSSFSTMNLENFALRDKILFNPTIQIKRGTPREKIEKLMTSVDSLLKSRKDIEIGPSPVRVSGITSLTLGMEIFAYTLTRNIDEFYKIEADLYLDLDAMLSSLEIELA